MLPFLCLNLYLIKLSFISISSDEDLKSNEQVEQILKELEVLFQNNIK